MRLWSTLLGELGHWKRFLFEAPLVLLILLAALGSIAAYQVRPFCFIDVGGIHDAPYLNAFHHPEPDRQEVPHPEVDYRWTRERVAVVLPGIGRQAVELRLRMQAYRPAGLPAPEVSSFARGVPLSTTSVGPEWQVYHLLIPEELLASGELAVELHSDTFQPPGDLRALGVSLDWIELRPAGLGWVTPAWTQVGSLAGAAALAYLLLRRLGMDRRWTSFLVSLGIGMLTFLLAAHRLSLTPYSSTLVLLLAWGCLLTALFLPCLERWEQRRGGTWRQARWLWACLLLGFLLRVGGMLYPQFRSSDLVFHAHRADWVASGTLLFTADLPDINMPAPYPPGLYVTLLPGTLFLSNTPLLLELVGTALDAVAGLLLYLLARRLSGRAEVALLALLVQEVAPITYRIYSWGNYTNLFSRVALVGVLFLLCAGRWRWGNRKGWALLTGVFVVVFLGHFADSLLFVAFLLAVAGLGLLSAAGRRALPWLLGALFAAGGIALGLYYTAPPGWPALLRLVALFIGGEGRPTVQVDPLPQLLEEQIPALVFLLALPGWALLARRQRRWPVIVCMGALLTAALFFLGQARFGLSSRYGLFVLPVVALGAGAILAAWGRRGRAGRLVSGLLLTCLVGYGLWSWWWLIGFGQR